MRSISLCDGGSSVPVEVFFNRPARPIPLTRLITDIAGARDELQVACAWFTLDLIAEAIIQSPARHKWIALNGADLARSGGRGRRIYEQFVKARNSAGRASAFILCVLGTQDYQEGILHHKTIVIDRRIVWTGSYNLTYHASKNYETLLRIDDGEVASQFAAEIQDLVENERDLWDKDAYPQTVDAFRCGICMRIRPVAEVDESSASTVLCCRECVTEIARAVRESR